MCVKSCHNYGLHAEFGQKNIKVGLEETAIATFRDDVVGFGNLELRNYLGAWSSGNGVISPKFEFSINSFDVCVVAEDNWYAGSSGCIQKTSCGWDDGFAPVTGKGSCYKVVE